MTNKQLAPKVRAWLKGTDVTPEDARRSVGVISVRAEQTPQRGRWWPLPAFRRGPKPPTADATARRPTSTPAEIGRPPTVTGRTRSMFSPVKAITAGALVFAIGGAFLVAQPFGQQGGVPGAASDEGMTPALVTGSLVSDLNTGSFYNKGTRDRIKRYELTGETARAEMSDPRLNGSVTTDWTQDQHWRADYPDLEGLDAYFVREPGIGVLKWGTVRIENDTGAWEGTVLETFDVTADTLPSGGLNVGVVELVGAGAYDGLSAVLFMRDSNAEMTDETDFTDYTVSWNGIIFPGNLPPDR